MIVTFCGHKSGYEKSDVFIILLSSVRELIQEGADTFYLGGYGNFDWQAARAVQKMKNEYPSIRSVLVIPYLNRKYDKKLYDEIIYPPIEKVPLRFAISKRNEWMVERADVIISGVEHNWGGAYTTLKFAERKKKRIIYI